MTVTVTIAPVRKSIRVNASRAHAFEVFTSGLARWWPRDMGIGKLPMKSAVMETHLGGRWYELWVRESDFEKAKPAVTAFREELDRDAEQSAQAATEEAAAPTAEEPRVNTMGGGPSARKLSSSGERSRWPRSRS